MVRSVNMKKTKSSKKIVLKITMSMTTLMFIGRSVAGISVESVSSESVDIVLPEWC